MQRPMKFIDSLPARLLLVILAFTLMIISSCLVMYYTLNQKLLRNAEQTMDDTQALFSRIILEPKAILNLIANNVEGIHNRGEGIDAIKSYITESSTDAFKAQLSVLEYYSVYMYFEQTGDFYDGLGWIPDDSYQPTMRPWYIAAIKAEGDVAMTPLYIDANTGEPIVSYSRLIYNQDGTLFGVIFIDVLIEYLRDMVVNKQITANSYGFMVDESFNVIMHPDSAVEGEPYAQSNNNLARFKDDISAGADISLERTINYEDMRSVIFGRQLDNGWYFILLVPESEYYGELNDMMIITGVLGSVFAALLILMLVRIEFARRKADEENRIKALQLAQAEGATRAKSSFLATMSHEIRTPMNAILGITEIQLQNENLDSGVRVALDKIYNAGDLLLSIINDILDLSKIEAGKLELVCVDYDVSDLIRDTVSLNIIRLGSKPVNFELKISDNIPAHAHGDDMRIKQVLNNILSNAFKYTKKGSVTLSVSAETTSSDNTADFIFKVTDTGQGMTTEQIDELFSDYSQFNKETNRTTEGTGLGMSITQNLLELMAGNITVESKPGHGSEFTVTIPQKIVSSAVLSRDVIDGLCQMQDTTAGTQMKRVQITREYMPYGSVLVVDDVETNIYVASGLLLPYGLRIDSAESGLEAISKVKSGKIYDVIFMDHMMPNMDGVETVANIRALGYTAPIIALTANAVAGQSDMFLTNGFDDYISKPIDVRQLNSVLNKWIRDKQPPEVLARARKVTTPATTATSVVPPLTDTAVDTHLLQNPKIIKAFIRDATRAIPVLESVVAENNSFNKSDLKNFLIHTHGLKSVLAIIGKTELSDHAQRLEAAGHGGDLSFIMSETPVFLQNLKALLDDITPKKQTLDIELSDDDKPILYERLKTVKEACDKLDVKLINNSIHELEQMLLPVTVKDTLHEISEYLLHSDFDAIIAAVDCLLGDVSSEKLPDVIEISGVDIQKGISKFSCDAEKYIKILQSFTESGSKLLSAMNAYRDDNISEYIVNVHGIMGMCYDIFADDLGNIAQRLEKAALSGDTAYIHANNNSFIMKVEKLLSDINAAISVLNSKYKKPCKETIDKELLKKLIEACNSFSMDKVDEVMREINKYRYIADEKLIDRLHEKIAVSEFKEVAAMLDGKL